MHANAVIAKMRQLRSPRLARGDLIACDFDGTITREDVGLLMLEAVGDPRGWELEERWRRGEIDSRECLRGQWGLANWTAERLDEFVASVEIDDGFVDLWRLSIDRRARLVILSDGLDLYLDPILRRLGLQPCDGRQVLGLNFGHCVPRYVNRARLRAGRVEIDFPYGSKLCDLCANCKVEHIFRLRPHFRRVIYIGDGHSDMCPARYADVVFAKGHLADDMAARCISFIEFRRLSEVVEVLRGDDRRPRFELLDHTADFAIRARGADLRELVENAAQGMLSVMGDFEGVEPARWHEIHVEAEGPEELLHHCLREVLYLFEDGDAPVAVEVEEARDDPPRATVKVATRPLREVLDRVHTEIKAVTYHNLRIRRDAGELVTEVVFDV